MGKTKMKINGQQHSVVDFVQGRHRVYDTSGLLSFTKPNKWWVVLPNGHMSIAVKLLRYSMSKDTSISGTWSYNHNKDDAKYFNDSSFDGDYYKSLAKALEHVLQNLDNGSMVTGGINMTRRTEGELSPGVCQLRNGRYIAYACEYDKDFKNKGKIKTKYCKTNRDAEIFSEAIRETNKSNLRALLVEHIRLLKTDPNKLPMFDQDEFKLVKINVAEQVAKGVVK